MIDTHTHINDPRLVEEVDDIVSSMNSNNLSHLIAIGCDRATSKECFDLSQKYPNVYSSVGIHPHDAEKATIDDYRYFEELSKNKKMVALGEIGLDFYYDLSPRDVQEKVFLEQLDLAHSLKIPTVIHLRDAYGLMLKLLKENKSKLEYGVVLHCYSGSLEMLNEFLKLDLMVAFGGSITFKNAVDKPKIVASTPNDRFFVETDCPYLTPVPFRGKTNYPKYVGKVVEKIAEYKNTTYEEIDQITTNNALRFFNKMNPKGAL
ncbi:MAG: TatD family hydrolase [Clostridia bacterium]